MHTNNLEGKNVKLMFCIVLRLDEVAKDSVNMWYEEEKKYKYKKAVFKSGTGHFTQVEKKEIILNNFQITLCRLHA
jgi:hypothetical protein